MQFSSFLLSLILATVYGRTVPHATIVVGQVLDQVHAGWKRLNQYQAAAADQFTLRFNCPLSRALANTKTLR